METTHSRSAADLRAMVARERLPLFLLGAAVGVHPARLGEMLNERRPLPPELARQIAQHLEGISHQVLVGGRK